MTGDKVNPLIMETRPNSKVIVCSAYTIEGPPQGISDQAPKDSSRNRFRLQHLLRN